MKPLINKSDIQKHTGLTLNIKDSDVEPHIKDAQEFDTIPILPIALLTAIETNIIANIQQWNRNETYAIGDKVFYDGVYYKCIAATTDDIPPNANYWALFELMNFYLNYLQPYIVYSAWYSFSALHGAQYAPAGLIQMADSTYNNLSDVQRGAILGRTKQKKDSCKLRMFKNLNDTNYTYDSVRYPNENSTVNSSKPGPTIYALGYRNKNNYERDLDKFCD